MYNLSRCCRGAQSHLLDVVAWNGRDLLCRLSLVTVLYNSSFGAVGKRIGLVGDNCFLHLRRGQQAKIPGSDVIRQL